MHVPARTILVVDDEDAIRTLLKEFLISAGHNVYVAADGKAALELLERNGAVDLVITDLVMPNQEGLGTIQEIRLRYPKVKIIAMSGAFGGQFLKTAKLLGVAATLVKPIRQEILLETVGRIFSQDLTMEV